MREDDTNGVAHLREGDVKMSEGLIEKFNEDEFKEYLDSRGISKTSRTQYVSQVRNFIKFMDKSKRKIKDEESFIEAMFRYIKSKPRVWHSRFSIKYYLEWKGMDKLYNNFMIKHKRSFKLQSRRQEKKSLSFGNIRKLCAYAEMPFKLILMLQYDTACRIGDILKLHKRHITLDEDGMVSIKIKEQKTGNIRTVYISKDSAFLLANYVKNLEIENDEKIFNVSYIVYERYLKKIGEKIDEPDLTSHWIRTSRAVHLLSKGYNIITIKKILGHSSIKTTEIYVREAGLDNKEIAEKESPAW